ncbi:MAG: AzlD domain-containing protein [Pseudomonadota bacterium]
MTIESLVLILLLALVTYATRFGGHLILARFGGLHPRVEAALDAVPGAVIAALVAPSIFSEGWPGALAAAAVIFACLRLSMVWAVVAALCVLVGSRTLLGV